MNREDTIFMALAGSIIIVLFVMCILYAPASYYRGLETKNTSFDVSGDEGYNITIDVINDSITFSHTFKPGEETVYIYEYRGAVKNEPFWYKNNFRYKVTRDFPDAFGFTIITGDATYSRTITSEEITRFH
jgi:hypothetical protein